MPNITKTLKDARGYDRTGLHRFHEISQGVRPALDQAAKAASWLPVKLEDKFNNEWWVVLAGTIVSIDSAIESLPVIVPCAGASAATLTYTASDVNYTVNIDSADMTDPSLVSVAGSSSAQIAINYPIGWAWHNMYTGSIEKRLVNYELQPFVSILCDYEIEIPLIGDNLSQSFEAGNLVKPAADGVELGVPDKWTNGSDSVELICGRILYKDTIPSGSNSRSAAHLQRPVRGLGLTGMENDGVPRHLDAYIVNQAVNKATQYVRINIALL